MRMAWIAVTTLLLASQAGAQTFAPSPLVAEASAPRPARAAGIPSALAVEASQAAIAACAKEGSRVTALVVDSAGAPIALISGDGAALITQRIASGKTTNVMKTGTTSGEAVAKANADKAFMDSLLADPAIGPPRPGGIPIRLKDQLIGAIAVSGGASGAQDEVCAKAGLAAVAARLSIWTKP